MVDVTPDPQPGVAEFEVQIFTSLTPMDMRKLLDANWEPVPCVVMRRLKKSSRIIQASNGELKRIDRIVGKA